MFGIMALLTDTGLIFVLIIWVLVSIAWWLSKKPLRTKDKMWLVWCIILSFIFVAIMAPRFYEKTIDYFLIKRLSPSEVVKIDVGTISWAEQSDVSKIVEALNQAEWYTVNHDIPSPLIPMKIKLFSERIINLRLGRYQYKEGAVIFFDGSSGSVFVPKLPELLESVGYQF